jgi:hypothetical protein
MSKISLSCFCSFVKSRTLDFSWPVFGNWTVISIMFSAISMALPGLSLDFFPKVAFQAPCKPCKPQRLYKYVLRCAFATGGKLVLSLNLIWIF